MNKPESVRIFDRLFWASTLIGVLNFLFSLDETSEKFARTPEFAAAGFGVGFIIATFAVSTMLNILIWYFISARASKIAKWILIVFFVVGLFSIVRNFNNPIAPHGLAFGVMMILTVMQGVGIYMLFRPDSLDWFNGKRVVVSDIFS
ncbi:hypothetical protein [Sphingopyxis sp. NJF-3]